MSLIAREWAKRQKLPGSQKAVLMAVADFADKQGRGWPSQQALADATGFTARTVRAALAAMETAGLLTREARGNNRGGRSSDHITLALDRTFDLTRPAEGEGVSGKSYRKGFRKSLQGYRKELPRNRQEPSTPSQVRETGYWETGSHTCTPTREGLHTREDVPTPTQLADDERYPVGGRA